MTANHAIHIGNAKFDSTFGTRQDLALRRVLRTVRKVAAGARKVKHLIETHIAIKIGDSDDL